MSASTPVHLYTCKSVPVHLNICSWQVAAYLNYLRREVYEERRAARHQLRRLEYSQAMWRLGEEVGEVQKRVRDVERMR